MIFLASRPMVAIGSVPRMISQPSRAPLRAV